MWTSHAEKHFWHKEKENNIPNKTTEMILNVWKSTNIIKIHESRNFVIRADKFD